MNASIDTLIKFTADEDLKAIFAYLQSLAPIKNQVPIPLGPNGTPNFE